MQPLSNAALGLLLILGDSISAGVGASRASLAYPALLHHNDAARWPAQRGADLAGAGEGPVPVLDLARGGATTADALRALQAWQHRPGRAAVRGRAIVVMTAGGNDLKNALFAGAMGAGPAQAQQAGHAALAGALRNLGQIVAILRDSAVFPDGCAIYLATVYDPSDGRELVQTPYGPLRLAGFSAAVKAWREAYVALAQRLDLGLVDAHALFLGHGYAQGRAAPGAHGGQDSWFADPIHPNDEGHHQLRLAFWRAMLADGLRLRDASAPSRPAAAAAS